MDIHTDRHTYRIFANAHIYFQLVLSPRYLQFDITSTVTQTDTDGWLAVSIGSQTSMMKQQLHRYGLRSRCCCCNVAVVVVIVVVTATIDEVVRPTVCAHTQRQLLAIECPHMHGTAATTTATCMDSSSVMCATFQHRRTFNNMKKCKKSIFEFVNLFIKRFPDAQLAPTLQRARRRMLDYCCYKCGRCNSCCCSYFCICCCRAYCCCCYW